MFIVYNGCQGYHSLHKRDVMKSLCNYFIHFYFIRFNNVGTQICVLIAHICNICNTWSWVIFVLFYILFICKIACFRWPSSCCTVDNVIYGLAINHVCYNIFHKNAKVHFITLIISSLLYNNSLFNILLHAKLSKYDECFGLFLLF